LKQISKGQIRKVLGQAICKHRERLGLTQEQLGEKADIHRTYLADIERGTRNPSVETTRRIAYALGISMSDLFKTAEAGTPTKGDS